MPLALIPKSPEEFRRQAAECRELASGGAHMNVNLLKLAEVYEREAEKVERPPAGAMPAGAT